MNTQTFGDVNNPGFGEVGFPGDIQNPSIEVGEVDGGGFFDEGGTPGFGDIPGSRYMGDIPGDGNK